MTTEEDQLDCPICLDVMDGADLAHPLQCTRMCGYNFCLTCVESLITSSRDDFMEASDGNMHVKVYLHCPNCRSDLGPTIRDTVLLRRAGRVEARSGCDDEELTASELRMRGAMETDEVKAAIAEARRKEADFFGRKYDGEEEAGGEEEAEEIEEIGIEADLQTGVHQSMRWPKQPAPARADSLGGGRKVDGTLLGGLEFAMSKGEREEITALMTSGDASKLAVAAETLHGITAMARRGMTPTQRAGRGGKNRSTRSSVFILIEEARQVREAAERGAAATEQGRVANKLAGGGARAAPSRPRSRQQQQHWGNVTASQHREAEFQLRRQMEFMKLYPLPVRMPKYVEIALVDPTSKKFALGFVDDTWDGTVLDAYCKTTIPSVGRRTEVKRKIPKNKGVYHILNMNDADDSFSSPRIDTERPRVLVSSVRAEGGRQGVVKGDVVTHVEGEEFAGTAEELVRMIGAREGRDGGDGTAVLRLVLNAERSTADALRRRALVMD